MKKIIALCLAIMLSLSLAACGGSDNGGADDTGNNTPNVQQPADNGGDKDVQQQGGENSDKKEWTFDNLDKVWSENEFEKLLPPLPFDGWTAEQDGNVYKMFTTNANADGSGMYYDHFASYYITMQLFGFDMKVNNELDGKPYDFSATDIHGNKFDLKCGDGCAWVTITKAE